MKKSELRQIIRESIKETINEGLMDSFVKTFDNLDDFVDKLKVKHPDAIEKTKEAIKQTGGAVGEELKQKGLEGLSYLNEKNTPERREKILSFVSKNKSLIVKGTGLYIIYNSIADTLSWFDGDGLIFELLILALSFLIVDIIVKYIRKGKDFLGLNKENTETEEIDFNMPLDLTGLLDL